MTLARKLVRDLRAHAGQSAAVFVVTALGVLLFVASAGAYLDLQGSYAHTRARLGLAALTVAVDGADAADVARVRALAGVRAVETRAVASLPVTIGGNRVELRAISWPSGALDRVLVTQGRMPSAADEIVVEKHLADHFRLAPGATVAAARGTLRVVGVGVSAEYLWVARDAHDIMPSPDAFGVGWLSRDGLRAQLGAVADDELLVAVADGATPATVAAAVRAALGTRVRALVDADHLPGVRLLQMDVDGYKGMAAFFPVLFLGVAAFIVAALLGRIVDAQRAIVGTFAALGVGRLRVLGHYLGYALVLGGSGALVGAIGGALAAPALTRAYATELGIPFVLATLHWRLLLDGVGIGLAVAAVGGIAPALHAFRLAPAEAMRPPRPSTGFLARAARRVRAPLPLRMAIRDVLGRPVRSLGTALGVAAALLLVLTTGALLDSMGTTIRAIFDDARRYDLRVDLVVPEAARDAEARLRRLAGVHDVEGVLALPVRLAAHGHAVDDVLLQGLADRAALLRSVDLDGAPVAPTAGGIVVTRAIAKSLGVRVGDALEAQLAPTATTTFRVAGLADATLGPTASARLGDLAPAFALDGKVTSLVLTVQPGALDGVRRAVAALPDVAHVEDLAALRGDVVLFMRMGWVMLLVMLACSVVLAAAILFNTATLAILERRRELATLRALGRTMREIAASLTLENAVLCGAGLLVGVPVSRVVIRRVLATFSSDLFRMPFVLSSVTVVTAIVGVVVVLLVAQWPALRTVARASLAESVRTREG